MSGRGWEVVFIMFIVVVIGVWSSVHNGIFLLGKRAKSGHVTPSFETWVLAFLFPPQSWQFGQFYPVALCFDCHRALFK